MSIIQFIRNNLRYYLRKNLLLALGVAVSGAVLTGALVVGDSVKYSLNQIVEHRLGKITHVIQAGDRYFTTGLSERVAEEFRLPVSSLLLQEGSAISDGGQRRVNRVQVIGVDPDFDALAGTEGFYRELSGDSVVISRNLANRLSVQPGDEILLRIERASLVPLNAPFVSDADNIVSFRAYIRDVAGDEHLGRFNLRVSQTAPFNVFVSRDRLERLMDFSGRVNVMLLGGSEQLSEKELQQTLRRAFRAEDAGLKIAYLEDQQQIQVSSHRVFIDEVLADQLSHAGEEAEHLVTYFVNSLEAGDSLTPYSFVSTLPESRLQPGEMIINSWLADDLGARTGDSIRMSYFVVGPLRELKEESASFRIGEVVSMEGRFNDRQLMPDLPGLSDVGNCRDWETGVPISLESIRDKDEDYWDEYGGMPKAFISVAEGERLWKNRFGTWTAFRFPAGGEPSSPDMDRMPSESSSPDMDRLPSKSGEPDMERLPSKSSEPDMERLQSDLLGDFDPALLGFTLESTRAKGMDAAANGVDFSQLFAGLSFFLLVAGILLTVLLFLLNLESRSDQLRTLVFMGIPLPAIRQIILWESLLVSLAGAAAGLVLAVFYNRAVFAAMNGVWSDVIRTEMMFLDVRPETLVLGLVITMAIAFLALWLPLNRRLRKQFSAHKKSPKTEISRVRFSGRKISFWIFVPGAVIALVLIGWQFLAKEGDNIAVFFSAGGLLLLAVLSYMYWYLSGAGRQKLITELIQLSRKNARRNLVRSMSIIILFSIGAFLVITTGSNRKDLFASSQEKNSGTGGFLFFAESTAPVLKQLNDPQVRYEFGLNEGYRFVQLRKAEGDDASCLNLNKIINPQILGVNPETLKGRFSFVTRTPFLEETDPWASLSQELEGGVIPAIADETVIKWGLGLTVGDTLHYTNSNGERMDLLLIGGLAPSIFQGNVLIAEDRFLEQYPESSGTHVFLLEGELSDTLMISSEVSRGMRDLGWDMELSGARLTRFYSVTNTYLSIFMVLGALGLLVGTFGLVVVLSRSILERRQEIALLKAVGYRRKDILRLITREYMILLLAGIGTGFLTAIVATLPSLLNPNTGTSFSSILIWLLILILNGWLWIQVVARSALSKASIYQSLRND